MFKVPKGMACPTQEAIVAAASDGDAVRFYETLCFTRAGQTVPMWIDANPEH